MIHDNRRVLKGKTKVEAHKTVCKFEEEPPIGIKDKKATRKMLEKNIERIKYFKKID